MYVIFFSPKKAYEVRISDGSSDVCSSDLRRARLRSRTAGGGDPVGPYPAGSPSYMSFRSLGESSVRYIPAPSLRCSRSIIFAVKSETRIAVSFGHRRSQVRHDARRAGDSSGGVMLTIPSGSKLEGKRG